MPFQTAPRRASCITCRKPIEREDRCYLGERTGMTWCLECAGKVTTETDAAPAQPKTGVRFPDGWGRFKPPTVKVYGERD